MLVCRLLVIALWNYSPSWGFGMWKVANNKSLRNRVPPWKNA